jgi:5-methyltetrahydrofolate--homocysteine methyltransferase
MTGRGAELLERLRSEVLVFDGAMGTMLFEAGLTPGACPELWNVERPEVLREVHRAYFEAGSDLVETNSFGGTRLKLKAFGLEARCRELNREAARLARAACPAGRYVAGSMGPTGHLPDTFEPLGDTPAELFSESFREQAAALAEGGVDLLAIETMMSPDEAVLAVRAAKEATGLPVLCSMTFEYNPARGIDRTMWGTSPAEAAARLVEAGADIVACNCGNGGPGRVPAILAEMRTVTSALLAAYPNAGIPKMVGDKTIYDLTPEAMAAAYPAILEAGARIVGACCGSTPLHVQAIAEVVRRRGGKQVIG